MLRRQLIPTRLIEPGRRAPMPIVESVGVPWFRSPRLLLSFIWLLLGLGWLRLWGRLSGAAAGQRVGAFLEQHGFLWVKLGQLLSLRDDLFSSAFCKELARLQFQARGFPFRVARQTIEEELGQPLGQAFAEFEELPFAAASISQVHRAVLRPGGIQVVVKVQRPDVQALFQRDMALIGGLTRLLTWLGIAAHIRWDDMLWELQQVMLEEIDYRYETANLLRMKRNLRAHGIYIPRVFEAVSRQRVLVMEYLEGVLMSDYIAAQRAEPGEVQKWAEDNRIDPRRVGRRLFETFLRQLMEDNLFHGDLHPGNIMLLRDSRLAFIDLGTVGTVETSFLERYMQSLKAVAEQDFGRAAELGLLLCPDIPQVDVAALKEDLVRCYREWVQRSALDNLPYGERSVMNMGNEANKVLNAYRVVLSMMYLKMARTWGTLDASLAYLIPDANYPKLIRGYFRKARRRSGKGRRIRRTLLNTVAEATYSLSELNQLLGPVLSREALVYQGEFSKAAYAGVMLTRCVRVALAGIVILWAARWWTGQAELLHGIVPLPAGFVGLTAAVLLPLAWLALGRVERRWRRRDVRLPQAPAILYANP